MASSSSLSRGCGHGFKANRQNVRHCDSGGGHGSQIGHDHRIGQILPGDGSFRENYFDRGYVRRKYYGVLVDKFRHSCDTSGNPGQPLKRSSDVSGHDSREPTTGLVRNDQRTPTISLARVLASLFDQPSAKHIDGYGAIVGRACVAVGVRDHWHIDLQ